MRPRMQGSRDSGSGGAPAPRRFCAGVSVLTSLKLLATASPSGRLSEQDLAVGQACVLLLSLSNQWLLTLDEFAKQPLFTYRSIRGHRATGVIGRSAGVTYLKVPVARAHSCPLASEDRAFAKRHAARAVLQFAFTDQRHTGLPGRGPHEPVFISMVTTPISGWTLACGPWP